MAGHSKWSKIKRQKAVNDTKRGKIFTKLLREVQVAAVNGSALEGNHRLKTAVQAAKSAGVPTDNIDRAIKRGSGELEGEQYEEVVYEAYGPAGVAMLIETLTDNRNRTVAEIRHILSRNNGSLGGSNSVAYLFEEKGVVKVPRSAVPGFDELFEKVLEAGGEDISDEDPEFWEVLCESKSTESVRAGLEAQGIEGEIELRKTPTTSVMLEGDEARSVLKLVDALDDLDDVQLVNANFEVDDEVMASLESE